MNKRLFDLFVSIIGILILAPLFVVVAVLICLQMGSPVLFRQQRPGPHGTPFELIKLRTMKAARREKGELLSDDERLRGLGKILRSTSLDELSELWSILTGTMSIVRRDLY